MADTPPFDQIGKRYEDSFQERDAQVAEGNWLISRLDPGARVLDLGCGGGLPTAKQLLDAGLDVVGVDESSVMLDLAGRQAPGGHYLHRDMRNIADLGEFDAAVAFFAFIMLPRRDIPPLLSTLRGQLRGPKLLQVAMVLGDFDQFPISFMGVPAAATAYPPDELAQVVERAGFRILDVDEVKAEAERNRLEVQIYLRAQGN
ncbi:class I SAM-dependent methyltransferase [Actinophytocola oryzae]|uniref:Methyltransferase family protein n=1 Tax=Actinophytocola oryzae TaxID=502181 RepID=A0A4R7VSD2_9PSEU|nr:class I SAM-dependent methyltransferase [Actinophytocola oryzae]TDV52395.1 methyltransferase family protein [Actinophytocola oryzae]